MLSKFVSLNGLLNMAYDRNVNVDNLVNPLESHYSRLFTTGQINEIP